MHFEWLFSYWLGDLNPGIYFLPHAGIRYIQSVYIIMGCIVSLSQDNRQSYLQKFSQQIIYDDVLVILCDKVYILYFVRW